MVVLDASVTLAWCFPDERTPGAEAVLHVVVRDGATAPAIWVLEVVNALIQAERRGRASAKNVGDAIARLSSLSLVLDHLTFDRVATQIMPLARLHQLTSYDAAYLELAIRRAAPLATLDFRLAQAAKAAGIVVIPA